MALSRLHCLVLFSTLGLFLQLGSAPRVSASSLNHTQKGLLPSTRPRITGFMPSSGPIGTSVTITGRGLTGATAVTFNGVAAAFTVNSDTQITTAVPSGATSGVIRVTTPKRTLSSPSPFLVIPAVTLSPTVGPPTTSVSVSGTGFGSTEAVDVYFDTTDEALAATNAHGGFTISIQVPTAAVPGTHWVTAVGRHSPRDAQRDFSKQAVQCKMALQAISAPSFARNVVESRLHREKHNSNKGCPRATSVECTSRCAPRGNSGLSAQAPFLVQTDWAQFRNTPRHTGLNPYENVLSPANVASLDLDWSAATGSYILSSPAVANGVVYVGSQDAHLYAYALAPGEQLKPGARPNPAGLHPNLTLRLGS